MSVLGVRNGRWHPHRERRSFPDSAIIRRKLRSAQASGAGIPPHSALEHDRARGFLFQGSVSAAAVPNAAGIPAPESRAALGRSPGIRHGTCPAEKTPLAEPPSSPASVTQPMPNDEVDALLGAAQRALLATLEEEPAGVTTGESLPTRRRQRNDDWLYNAIDSGTSNQFDSIRLAFRPIFLATGSRIITTPAIELNSIGNDRCGSTTKKRKKSLGSNSLQLTQSRIRRCS